MTSMNMYVAVWGMHQYVGPAEPDKEEARSERVEGERGEEDSSSSSSSSLCVDRTQTGAASKWYGPGVDSRLAGSDASLSASDVFHTGADLK